MHISILFKILLIIIILFLFQTKTQMNDLMDGLIQDMSTGNYTTKRPYPVARFVICNKVITFYNLYFESQRC